MPAPQTAAKHMVSQCSLIQLVFIYALTIKFHSLICGYNFHIPPTDQIVISPLYALGMFVEKSVDSKRVDVFPGYFDPLVFVSFFKQAPCCFIDSFIDFSNKAV